MLAEPVPPNVLDAFKKALETARVEIEKLRGRIPSLKVKLAGPGVDRATVRVDGIAITAAEIASGKALDPGEHRITAEAPSASGRGQITLKEGDADGRDRPRCDRIGRARPERAAAWLDGADGRRVRRRRLPSLQHNARCAPLRGVSAATVTAATRKTCREGYSAAAPQAVAGCENRPRHRQPDRGSFV